MGHSPLLVGRVSADVVLAVLTDHRERRQEDGLEGHDRREQPVRLALHHTSDQIENQAMWRLANYIESAPPSCARAARSTTTAYEARPRRGDIGRAGEPSTLMAQVPNLRFASSDRPVA